LDALYETFDAVEARCILRRLEIYYTPKHASWLNMVEIEIGVMVSQCLDRRIPRKEMLVKEVKAWPATSQSRQIAIQLAFHRRPSPRKTRQGLSQARAAKPESCCRLNTVTFSVSRY
jgi:DDE superfamily endonuclease